MKLKVFKTSTFIPDEMPFPEICWKDSHFIILVFDLLSFGTCAHVSMRNPIGKGAVSVLQTRGLQGLDGGRHAGQQVP